MSVKHSKYFAVACYAYLGLQAIESCLDEFAFNSLLSTVGVILIIVALLKSVPKLSALGFAAWSIPYIKDMAILVESYDTIKAVKHVISLAEFRLLMGGAVATILTIVVCALLVFVSIKPVYAANVGIAAAIVAVARLIVFAIGQSYVLKLSAVLWGTMFAAGALFLSLAYKDMVKQGAETHSPTAAAQGLVSGADDAEQLAKWKSLLDNGAITQEEFDDKKRQLLGITPPVVSTTAQQYTCPQCGAAVTQGEQSCKACGQMFNW